MPKRGLPETVRMRHDEHYVDALTSSAGSPIGRMVPMDLIDANPNQPRQVMGDLSELMASIAEKGIIEPIIVRQRGPRFQIVAGERRYQAAVQVGMARDPGRDPGSGRCGDHRDCVGREHPAEGSDRVRRGGSAVLLQTRCNYTHEDMARRLGKSRTAITESLSLNGMPEDVKNLCRLADIHSKSMLLQIVRQNDSEKMVALVEKIVARRRGRRAKRSERDGQAQTRASEVVHLQLPGPDQGVQPAAAVQQVAGRSQRGDLGARSDHRGPATGRRGRGSGRRAVPSYRGRPGPRDGRPTGSGSDPIPARTAGRPTRGQGSDRNQGSLGSARDQLRSDRSLERSGRRTAPNPTTPGEAEAGGCPFERHI